MRLPLASVLVLSLASLILLSGQGYADLARAGHGRHGPRDSRRWWASAAVGPSPSQYVPCDPPQYLDDGTPVPCPTGGSTAGSTASSGSTATTGSTGQTTSGNTTGTTGQTTASTDGSSGTTSGPPSPTGGSTSTATGGGTPPTGTTGDPPTPPDPGPDPDPGPPVSTTGTTGTGWDDSGSGTTVDGVQPNGKVSGTNVNVAFALVLRKTADSPYDRVLVQRVDPLSIGGAALPAQTVGRTFPLPAKVGDAFTFALPVRFASTHFADAASVPLAAKFYYELQGGGAPAKDYAHALPAFKVVAYNKGLTLSTNYVAATSTQAGHTYNTSVDGAYADPDDPGYPSWPATSWRTVAIAKSDMPSIHHSLTDSNDRLTKSALLTDLQSATILFADTHGSGSNIAAYAGPDTFGPIDLVSFFNADGSSNDVATATGARATDLPGMNLVILHACETVPDLTKAGAITNAYRAFFGPKMVDGNVVPDTAYAGFGLTAYSVLADYDQGSDRCLDLHAKDVYNCLLKGYTIQEALDHANFHCPPYSGYVDQEGDNLPLLMLYSGDPFTRLMTVYTGAKTPGWHPIDSNHLDFPNPPTAWYKVNP